jgi:hypothetical protein
MRVSAPDGTETEIIGPALAATQGEVFVLDGRFIRVAELWASFSPRPERRISGERRHGERRRNRSGGRRQVKRRLRDHVSEAEAWARVVRVSREARGAR